MRTRKGNKTMPGIDAKFAPLRRTVPHRFILDAIAEMEPTTRAMFGSLAVYVGEKIVFLLRNSQKDTQANGVWVAVPPEYQDSVKVEFPKARSVHILGKDIKGWYLLSPEADDFEESALRACELVSQKDRRIGKVPDRK